MSPEPDFAALAAQPAPIQAQPIEIRLNGCDIMVNETKLPNGMELKEIVMKHPSGHFYILPLTLVQAKELATVLAKPLGMVLP